MTFDFTLEKYTQLCSAMRSLPCPVMTVREFLEAGQPQHFVIVLRHDVDRFVQRAVRMAELESSFGIQSTYYLRAVRSVFQESEIRRVSGLGHEVGYHYETITKAKGSQKQAIELFEKELEQFRRIVHVDTISMHGSPLTPWNNLGLWQTYDFESYDIAGDAVLSIEAELYYFTDAGRSWDAGRYNIRDHMTSRKLTRRVDATDDLIDFMENRPDCPVYINAHPHRWASSRIGWSIDTVSEWAINQVKWGVSLLRDQRS